MIEFDKVNFGYEKTETLKNISFTIEKGDFVAILGANGAGKTTLSKLFGGILKPKSGNVTVMDMNTKTTKTSKLAKHIGFLFQNPDRQICKNTVRDEIAFGLKCVGCSAEETAERTEKTLLDFSFNGDDNPFMLSRGERQRLALASLIAVNPEILILDEPTTGLDYGECIHIMDTISQLNRTGVTIIMVTHDMEIVLDYAKKVMVLADGNLLAFDGMRKIMKNEDLLNRARLLPPQIAGLANKLVDFDEVFTNDEMFERILERRKENERVS